MLVGGKLEKLSRRKAPASEPQGLLLREGLIMEALLTITAIAAAAMVLGDAFSLELLKLVGVIVAFLATTIVC